MALTFNTYQSPDFALATSQQVTGVAYTAGSPIIIAVAADSASAPVFTPSSTIPGLTWTLKKTYNSGGSGGNTSWQDVWEGIPATSGTGATITLSVTGSITGPFWVISTTNGGPSTNYFTGTVTAGSSTAFSQSITPTTAGSALFMITGDGNGVSSPNITAGASCTVSGAGFDGGNSAWSMLTPTVNPLANGSAFTLAATTTTEPNSTWPLCWVAFEIPAVAQGSSSGQPIGGSVALGGLFGASSGASGSGATTEGTDVSSGAGGVSVSGAGATAEGADTSTASGVVAVSGTAAITEGADVSSGSGTAGSTATGTAAITEGADTSTATGVVTITGTASFTEGADTSAATGAVNVSGTAAITEVADTSTASGVIGVAGTAAITEGADVSSGAGAAGSSAAGTGASVEAPDVSSATGVVTLTGTASITEGADTSTATGSVNAAGTAAITEGADTSTASGVVTVTGTAAFTEGADTSAGTGTGTAGSAAVGSGATVEDFDVSAGTGALGVSGTAAITEGFDTSTAAGLVVIVGTGATVEGSDISAGTGSTPIVITSADALLLWQIYKLHGLSSDPLVVTATSRTAGDITQTVSGTTAVTVTTTGTSAALGQGVSTMIQELAALHGISTPLTTTPTTRSAGTINQTLVSANGTVTVTRQ